MQKSHADDSDNAKINTKSWKSIIWDDHVASSAIQLFSSNRLSDWYLIKFKLFQ